MFLACVLQYVLFGADGDELEKGVLRSKLSDSGSK